MAAVVPLWQLEDRSKRRERVREKAQKAWKTTAQTKPAVIEREVERARSFSRSNSRVQKHLRQQTGSSEAPDLAFLFVNHGTAKTRWSMPRIGPVVREIPKP